MSAEFAWCLQNVLGDLDEGDKLEVLRTLSKEAFTSKSQENGESYSSGSTFFVRVSETPTCLLEELALAIFHFHSKRMDWWGTVDPKESGIEWWTQVIDSRDDIAWHWDRDYQLEEEEGIHRYPTLATVTYLTSEGGATVIVNCRGSLSKETRLPTERIDSFVLSRPEIGKHLYFNGEMLHAAPASIAHGNTTEDSDEDTESQDSDESSQDEHPIRITFLANIWINHIPKYSNRFPANSVSSLQLSPTLPRLNFDQLQQQQPPTVVCTDSKSDSTSQFHFRDDSRRFLVTLQLPLGFSDALQSSGLIKVSCDNPCSKVEDLGVVEEESDSDSDSDSENLQKIDDVKRRRLL